MMSKFSRKYTSVAKIKSLTLYMTQVQHGSGSKTPNALRVQHKIAMIAFPQQHSIRQEKCLITYNMEQVPLLVGLPQTISVLLQNKLAHKMFQ